MYNKVYPTEHIGVRQRWPIICDGVTIQYNKQNNILSILPLFQSKIINRWLSFVDTCLKIEKSTTIAN